MPAENGGRARTPGSVSPCAQPPLEFDQREVTAAGGGSGASPKLLCADRTVRSAPPGRTPFPLPPRPRTMGPERGACDAAGRTPPAVGGPRKGRGGESCGPAAAAFVRARRSPARAHGASRKQLKMFTANGGRWPEPSRGTLRKAARFRMKRHSLPRGLRAPAPYDHEFRPPHPAAARPRSGRAL